MSNLILKKEIRSVIRNSGQEVNSKMLCSIVKLMNMRYRNLDKRRVVLLTNELLYESKA
ncbi:hypothetical protein [Halarcobacter bivalviorum]|uniref:hypothetical protein n=1 Tax=Halarcobacter bivalviorum TaxID=663364 RepID=UPI0013E93DF4|nr:hypothetical protein [Halarcobacter bivalviorum]